MNRGEREKEVVLFDYTATLCVIESYKLNEQTIP